MNFLRSICLEIKTFAKRGLFHIVGSNVLSQVCGLISSIVVIRHLAKTEYGFYVEANNIYSYFSIFVGIGYATALLQFCSENIESPKKILIYRFTLFTGTIFNLLLAILIYIFGMLKCQTVPEVGYYIKLMCFLPFVVYFHHYFQVLFRVQRNNKFYSFTNSLFSVCIVICNITFTYFWGIKGLVLSTYVAHITTIIAEVIYLLKDDFFHSITIHSSYKLDKKDKIDISKYAFTTTITNFSSTMLILLDVTCLGLILHSPEVLADYKVATTIPSAFGFIPSALMVFFYPELVQKYSGSYKNLINEIRYLLKIYLVINGLVFIVLFLFSRQIILIVYGEKYQNIVPIFRLLSLNFFVGACGRKILGNAVAVTRRVQINFYFSVVSGAINIILNILLITAYGSYGAAIATFLVTTILVIMYIVYFFVQWKKEHLKDDKLQESESNV